MLNLLTLDEMITYGDEIYYPENWINILVAGQDFTNAAASISDRCQADVFLVKFAELCSIQGLSALGLRILGALLQQGIGFGLHSDPTTFDSSSQNTVPYTSMSFQNMYYMYIDAPTDFYKAEVFGYLFSILFAYQLE